MKTIYKIFIAKILSRILTFFISKNQNVTRNSIRWCLDLNEGIDLSIYLFGTSEKKIVNLRKIFTNKNESLTILDIGANIGSVSLVIAKMFKNSKIFAIEPTNYAFNKLSNISAAALGSLPARIMVLSPNRSASCSLPRL